MYWLWNEWRNYEIYWTRIKHDNKQDGVASSGLEYIYKLGWLEFIGLIHTVEGKVLDILANYTNKKETWPSESS